MPDAISYKRFSSPKQGRGDTERRQTDLAKDYCERHQLRLINTYLDAGLSGFAGQNLGDRGALRVLLSAAQAGKFKPGTHLIVESLDRLSRQEISAAVRLFLDILDTGLVIVTLIDGEQVFTKERVDNDLSAIVIAVVILSRAHNESRAKRERALQAQQIARDKARQHNVPITAECPRWLTLVGTGDDRHFVVDRSRARVVEHIFQLAASGMGQIQLARYLNAHHVPTFGSAPRWRPGMVGHLLCSRAVLGEFKPCISVREGAKHRRVPDPEGPIANYFPAIVETALFNKVQLAKRARRRHYGRRVIPAHSNLVTRLGRCGVCGGSLFLSQTMDGFAYLRCTNARERECSNNRGFPYRKLEAVLLAIDALSRVVASLMKEHAPSHFDSMQADTALQIGFNDYEDFLKRFVVAKSKLNAPDIVERHLARAALVGEFRAFFDGVVLHPDRVVTLHSRPDISGYTIVYAVSYEGTSIQIRAVDGVTGFIPPAVLSGLVRPVQNGISKVGEYKIAWQPRAVDALVENIRVVFSPDGDWQAVLHDPTQMAEVVARAERAMRAVTSIDQCPVQDQLKN